MMSKLTPRLAKHIDCTGCMACVDSCGFGALRSCVEADGHLYPSLDSSKCTLCKKCERACPIVSGFVYRNTQSLCAPYAAWANDDEIRSQGASGGVFGAIATQFIKDGGVVAGAVIEGVEVKYVLADKIETLSRIQNSKYQQGDLSGIFADVKIVLKSGRKVLFSGTGCQVAAMLSYLGGANCENLFTIDLICGGFPSTLSMQRFVKEERLCAIDSFRNKKQGWHPSYALTMENYNGEKINYKSNNLVISAFLSHLTNRYSCLNCRFAFATRRADITIADFWGDVDFEQEHQKGLSAVILHSPKGEQLIHGSNITSHKTELKKITKRNYRLVYGKFYLRYHPARVFMVSIFRHFSYENLKKLYGAKVVSKSDFLIFPFRAATILYLYFWRCARFRFMKSNNY